jgi:hypothetical protein
MNLLKRLWVSLRGGAAYEELEHMGTWATWQLPVEGERQDAEPEGNVRRLDKHRD